MPEPEKIKELGFRIKNKDREAFHILYREFFASLQAYAVRYVYDWQDAQDIVQDAYFSLWANLHQYDPSRNIFSYLLVMVKNSCINHIRHLKVKDSHQDKIVEAMLFSQIDDPETDEGLKERLQQVLETLPEKGYRILTEHFWEHKKVTVIATEMGIAESTVKTHLKRVMKILRENLLFIIFGIGPF